MQLGMANRCGIALLSTASVSKCPLLVSHCPLLVSNFSAMQPPATACLQRFIQDVDHLSEFSRAHDYYYDLEQDSKRNWLDGDLCLPNRHHAKEALAVTATLTSPDQYHKEQEALEVKHRAKENLRAFKEDFKASRIQSCTGA